MVHIAGKGMTRWGHICIVIVVNNNRVGLLGQLFVECCFIITT